MVKTTDELEAEIIALDARLKAIEESIFGKSPKIGQSTIEDDEKEEKPPKEKR